MSGEKLTVQEAAERLRAGGRVWLVVGIGEHDPTLLLWVEEGSVVARAVKGWSAGVEEAVCALSSPFLLSYLDGRHELTAAPAAPAPTACIFHPDRPALPSGPALCASCEEATADARSGGW